jgi:hypothetical protein
VRTFSTGSRPALRAAACGGRPRAGNDAAATGELASPSHQMIPLRRQRIALPTPSIPSQSSPESVQMALMVRANGQNAEWPPSSAHRR